MSVFKCKMCGGDIDLTEGSSVAVCEYCGTKQTVPTADNEKKMTLFARANRLRSACEFDKAASVYESIVVEFPQEAEAYWGLVLCRYGIEYVDDPATGRKVPTCHRSSFDSILEDSDFEQACENADPIARRVYRDEAKTIEDIRKGIVEVSGKEPPYDIFICYKETNENGERTIDSVIAQDVYDALTEKGYRVFFSRITLEDKLGTEYEPYIFAALNSAKVMLVFGTDYEYFSAVWVKNEWSRYLQLMTKDKSKHLIPCFKGIGAYDMPKEFAHLQAQDMGKVGATQDLLRGIEKLMPKEQPAAAVQERVIVTGGADSKINSLLDRGNMALEDQDWASASKFFEEVLNNDSKNAQAYVGKALAAMQVQTLHQFMQKFIQVVLGDDCHGPSETLSLTPAREHELEILRRYTLPRYVEKEDLHELYEFDLTYHSEVSNRSRDLQRVETRLNNQKGLMRAERFATGETAEMLAREKKFLFDTLSKRLEQAKIAENAEKTALQERYAEHLKQADQKAEELYQEGVRQRSEDYQRLAQIAESSNDLDELEEAAEALDALEDYQNSRQLAERCRSRAIEECKKQEAEAERQRVLREKAAKERAVKNRKIGIVVAIVAVVVVAAVMVTTKVIIPNAKYNAAVELLNAGKYEESVAAFEAMGDYKDAKDRIPEAYYAQAESLLSAGKSKEAIVAFWASDNYKDARDRVLPLWDEIAIRDTVAAGIFHTVGLKANGTVVAMGYNGEGQCDVDDWTDIVAISADGYYTVGLKADGTVVAVGDNTDGQCEVSDWRDIVAISAGYGHTVGLKADGTVVAVGDYNYDQCEVFDWRDILAVSAGTYHTVGLKADGTVVAVGDNEFGQCEVSDWTNVAAISAGYGHTVGLKSDGTVVAVGSNEYGQCNVTDWRDIVAVSAGTCHTVGLKADGTVVAVGDNSYDQCNVADWRNVVAISARYWHTVGLKADGTVVAVGFNEFGQCDASGWTNIKVPK